MYLDNSRLPQFAWQFVGKSWKDVDYDERVALLKNGNPHGRCIYKCGGDLVDHQNVSITFADGSTAVHTLILGSMRPGRSIWVQGTLGEAEGWAADGKLYLYKYDKKTSRYLETSYTFQDKEGETGGHFGGDKGLVADFCDFMLGNQPSVSCTSIEDSLWGHLTCYAADESQKTHREEKV